MVGHPDHDLQFVQLLADPARTSAVLWPTEDAISMAELQAQAAAHTQGRITLIAVDATWPGARRMAASYPADLIRVRLDSADMPAGMAGRSLMAPLRKYKPEDPYANRYSFGPSQTRCLRCVHCAIDPCQQCQVLMVYAA